MTKNNNDAPLAEPRGGAEGRVAGGLPAGRVRIQAMRIYLCALVTVQILVGFMAVYAMFAERLIGGALIFAFYVVSPVVWRASRWQPIAKHQMVLAGALSAASILGMAFVGGELRVFLIVAMLVVLLPLFVLAAVWDQESDAQGGKQELAAPGKLTEGAMPRGGIEHSMRRSDS